MKARKFIKIFFIFIGIFLFYHLIVWTFFTSQIFGRSDGKHVGDLGRMSYQVDFLLPRELQYTLSKQHINKTTWNNQRVDIVTIGDSFFNLGSGGKNPYFQDYLATDLDKNVLNIQNQKGLNSLETIIGLYNNGTLERLKPKVIILESVVRENVGRFSKKIDFDLKFQVKDISELLVNHKNSYFIPETLPINTANYKLPYYVWKYKKDNHAIKSVYKFKLKKDLFSSKVQDEILIYNDDIKNLKSFTLDNIQTMNDNLNKLSLLLKRLNIELIFIPAIDKYDLYFDYIVENRYEKNYFFDLIRPLEKKYIFIDTKAILKPLLEQGVKDVYYADDTHWSNIASEKIIKEYQFQNLLF